MSCLSSFYFFVIIKKNIFMALTFFGKNLFLYIIFCSLYYSDNPKQTDQVVEERPEGKTGKKTKKKVWKLFCEKASSSWLQAQLVFEYKKKLILN